MDGLRVATPCRFPRSVIILWIAITCSHSFRPASPTPTVAVGMSESAVLRLLGAPCDLDGYGPGYCDFTYWREGWMISFDDTGRVFRVERLTPRDIGRGN